VKYGEKEVLGVGEKWCLCKGQFTVASQQNIINHISLFWDKPISWLCVGDTLSER